MDTKLVMHWTSGDTRRHSATAAAVDAALASSWGAMAARTLTAARARAAAAALAAAQGEAGGGAGGMSTSMRCSHTARPASRTAI